MGDENRPVDGCGEQRIPQFSVLSREAAGVDLKIDAETIFRSSTGETAVQHNEDKMSKKHALTPWHEVVSLRDDLKSGALSLAVFAADLYDVVLQRGQQKVYEDPASFFALTFPTLNLRDLVRDVAQRLAGQSDKAYRSLSVTYGGGKTHTLITLWHLVQDLSALPELQAVDEFEAHIGGAMPRARVAALCFDKIDLELGVETPAPDGSRPDAQASLECSRLPTGWSRRVAHDQCQWKR